MNKSIRSGFFAFLLLAIVISSPLAVSAQICTQDAMICPDGTGVGRSGPNCTFTCPGDKIDNTFKPNNTDISAKIKSLLAQIKILQEKIRGLSPTLPIQTIPNDYIGNCVGSGCDTSVVVQDGGVTSVQEDSVGANTCHHFSRNLSVGSRGNDVLQLQQMLAGNNLLQQDSITGYFGARTKVALGLWQIASGIPQVGAFGPKSRAFLKGNCNGGGGIGGGVVYPNDPPQYVCTMDAVQCPDGSYVGRTGPKCEAICPSPTTACVPRPACLDTAPYCQIDIPNVCPSVSPKPSIITSFKECEKAGYPVAEGNPPVCYAPDGKSFTGSILTPSTSACTPACGVGYTCTANCGSPAPYIGEPHPGYSCLNNAQVASRNSFGCPICLAGKTQIDTPSGLVQVKDIKVGMSIWTTDKTGRRVSGVVAKTSKVPVPSTHKMVHLVLNDGRDLYVSPGHPTIDGRTVANLTQGESYDNAVITSTQRVSYDEGATYDVLPSGDTGFYWANGVLLGSTLR
ncbi:MAG: peptidoglycan-binding protein [Patescibacteria group bacterium]